MQNELNKLHTAFLAIASNIEHAKITIAEPMPKTEILILSKIGIAETAINDVLAEVTNSLHGLKLADAETRCVADWINQNGLSDYDCIASEPYGYENDHDATGFIGACDCNEYSFIHKSR